MAGVGAAYGVTDLVEVDVRRTADDVLVLAHDPQIQGLEVRTTSSRRLTRIQVGGHCIPTLDEVIEAFPDRRLDIEIKSDPDDPRLPQMVAERARSQDIVTSFWWPDMDGIRSLDRDIVTGLLVGEGGSLDDAAQHATSKGHTVVAPHHSLLSAREVDRLHGDSLEIVAWTVDDPSRAMELAGTGVEVVVTDDPGSIVSVLEEQR